jgi:peptidoglycan/xylan/chitin deacetylase (PgdA/CDA1 family)
MRARLAAALALVLAACASAPPAPPAVEPAAPAPPIRAASPRGPVLAQDDRFIVVLPQAGDTPAALAARYLGDAGKGWWIAEFNATERVDPSEAIVIPRKGPDPLGVARQAVQTVPILCYHRFGSPKRRLSVTRADFEAQMEYLARNGYHVVPLAQVAAFLEGKLALPPKSVAITIDDGYRSTYEIAFPVLRKHGFPATVFLYSDFVGAGDALTWVQMQEMQRSGVVEIQPHSKSHANLTLRLPNESQAQYRDRMRAEVERPAALIGDRLGIKAATFAYPYGDVNEAVVGELQRLGVTLGVTVTPGGNPFYAHPYMLRRTMVFGTDDLDTFKGRLAVSTRVPPR